MRTKFRNSLKAFGVTCLQVILGLGVLAVRDAQSATVLNAATSPPQSTDTFTNGMTVPLWTSISAGPYTLSAPAIIEITPGIASYYGDSYFNSTALYLGYDGVATLGSSAGLFDLNAVSFADEVGTGVVDVTATFGNGSSQTIAFNTTSSALAPFAPGWTNLTSLSFTRSAATQSNIVFDNLTVSAAAPVPLPASACLLLSGIAGFGVMARRRAA